MNRCPGPSYQDILDTDNAPAPEILRESGSDALGAHDLPVDVYLSADYHRREVDHLWRAVWQIAGRVEDVANPGDSFVYDLADDSLIIVRTQAGKLRAYHNACLHRGTRLRDEAGSLERIRCPFHGFTWSLDGDLADVPCRWDFPQIDDDHFRLPEARVDTWGGRLLQNYCEGICRDLLVHGMFQLEGLGCQVIAHVHDEIIAEVPEGHINLATASQAMCSPLEWAEGFPVSADGFIAKRYRKE